MNIYSVEQENETYVKNDYQEHPPPSIANSNKKLTRSSSSSANNLISTTQSTISTLSQQQTNELDRIDIIDLTNTNKLTDEERKRRHDLESATQRLGILNKTFSTKCLIMFGILSISIVIVCCILMGVFTTSYILKSNRLQSYLNQLESNKITNQNGPYLEDDMFGLNSTGSDKSSKFERNAFNWIKDTIRKTFFGLKDDEIDDNINNLNTHAISNSDLFNKYPQSNFNGYQYAGIYSILIKLIIVCLILYS
jgi:hypothetical protein